MEMEEERKEALLYFEDILGDEDKGENDLRTEHAWLNDLTYTFKALMDLSKNDWAFRNSILTKLYSAFHIRGGFPSKLRRKLMKCKGEGQELFENMLSKIEEFRENIQEDLNTMDKTLDGDNTINTMDTSANSETGRTTDISGNDAEKVDVKLSAQKIEKTSWG